MCCLDTGPFALWGVGLGKKEYAMSCAFCGSDAGLVTVTASPREDEVILCATCNEGVSGAPEVGPHWQCLNDAIWSEDDAVKVLAYRTLHKLTEEGWVRDLLDIAYLEPEVEEWAKAGIAEDTGLVHKDTNGAVLAAGDTVVLIKDLPVKGAGFTAKRGTAVRGISLVPDNAGHIEGRVNGQRIVILTEFVKKS